MLICLFIAMLMTMMLKSQSPFKMSLYLTTISLMMGMCLYMKTNSMFLCSSLIISFSSGMMILFSYSSLSCNHEFKNKSKMNSIMYFLMFMLILMTTEKQNFSSMENLCNNISFSMYLLFLMFMVFVSMKSMNLSFFKPSKKFMQSY